MQRLPLLAASSMVLCAVASAQQTIAPQAVPGQVKDAGILHLATGTWTRATSATSNLGPDTIYINDANSGYFTTANVGFENTDEGRIPTLGGSIAGATVTTYNINCFVFGYCSDQPNTSVDFTFYDSYAPCDDVQAPASCLSTAGSVTATGLPGGPTATSCWIVTLDLTGVEVCLEGDGGSCSSGFDGSIALDAFGWGHTITTGGASGPLLRGDPDWTVSTAGALQHGGGGTYYDPSTTCGQETGLDTQDLWYATDTGGLAPGCYWFGGYLNTNGCGGPTNNPMASFYGVAMADTSLGDCTPGSGFPTFCDPANNNSTGFPGVMAASGSGSVALPSPVHIEMTGGPANQFGYVLVSATSNAGIPVSQGLLCLSAPQGRFTPGAGGVFNSLGQFDGAGVYQNLGSTSTTGTGYDIPNILTSPPAGAPNTPIAAGETWHYQCWYRDGSNSNFTNGVSITFTP